MKDRPVFVVTATVRPDLRHAVVVTVWLKYTDSPEIAFEIPEGRDLSVEALPLRLLTVDHFKRTMVLPEVREPLRELLLGELNRMLSEWMVLKPRKEAK